MPTNEIRIPKQKRSIEKKDAIIVASYELFCEKGYYKTNTAEIAKAANVSTGIVYNYFHDKHDILKEVIGLYISRLESEFRTTLSRQIQKEDLHNLVKELLDALITSHTMNVSAHNEFMALALLDPEIQNYFVDFEARLLAQIKELLISAEFSSCFLEEKLRIAFGIIEQLCHDYMQQIIDEAQLSRSKVVAVQAITSLIEMDVEPEIK